MKPNRIHSDQRSGIALITVLGFLAILLLLGITSAVTMRTERMAAEFGKDAVKAEIMLSGTLDSILDEVDEALLNWTNVFEAAPPSVARPVNIHFPTNFVVYPSTNVTPGDAIGAEFALLSGQATDWVHRVYLDETNPFWINGPSNAAMAEWIEITDPVVDNTGNNPILGRYAFVVFDNTGLLDVNVVGDDEANQRVNGLTGFEIGISNITEIANIGPVAADFRANRSYYHRFSTFPDIINLNDGFDSLSGYNEVSTLDDRAVNNLTFYSLCYDNGWWDWGSGTWEPPGAVYTNATLAPSGTNITGAINRWNTNEAMVVFAELLGANVSLAGEIATNFFDYTDTNRIPRSVDSFATEACPMINEIVISGRMDAGPTNNVTHTITLTIETWYPFPGNAPESGYAMSPALTVDNGAATTNGIRFGGNPGILPTVGAAQSTGPIPATFSAVHAFPTQVVYTYVANVTAPSGTYAVAAILNEVELFNGAGILADRVRLPGLVLGPYSITTPGPGDFLLSDPERVSVSANDPRHNHRVATWSVAGATLGAVNVGVTGQNPIAPTSGVESLDLFVRDRAIDSAAELGMLNVGGQWETLALYTPVGKELLSKFRADPLVAKTYTNGLVHPNSYREEVIESVFRGAPVERYPGEGVSSLLHFGSPANLSDMAARFHSVSVSEPGDEPVGTNMFFGRGTWVDVPELAVGGLLSSTYNNDEREAIIRNTYRLFNPNQNLFTIVFAVQTINDQPDAGNTGSFGSEDVVTGEKRAVAVVWRDPFPDAATGRNEMHVVALVPLNE